MDDSQKKFYGELLGSGERNMAGIYLVPNESID